MNKPTYEYAVIEKRPETRVNRLCKACQDRGTCEGCPEYFKAKADDEWDLIWIYGEGGDLRKWL